MLALDGYNITKQIVILDLMFVEFLFEVVVSLSFVSVVQHL
jgi:hypothetical protein